MSEYWRRKDYYKPRLLTSTAAFLAEPVDEILLCLNNTEISLILAMLEYAHRRSTWVSERHDSHYVAPSNEEWNDIEIHLAELEGKLMVGCCDAIIALLEEIRDAIELLEGKDGISQPGDALPPDWETIPGITRYFGWGSTIPDEILVVSQDDDRCALAQLWYQAVFELTTETFLPSLRVAWSSMLPAAAWSIAVWTGGITFPVVIGALAFSALLEQLLDVAYDVAETNLGNWITGAKPDLVCAMYTALDGGSQMQSTAEAAYQAAIAPAQDLSFGDKLILRLAGQIAILGARRAQEQATGWAEFYVTPNYCVECDEEEPPDAEGTDWYAIAIPDGDAYAILTKSGGAGWANACVPIETTRSDALVGIVWEVETITGGCTLKAMTAETAGCSTGDTVWPDSTGDRANGLHFNLVQDRINQGEAWSALCPGAAVRYEFIEWSGPGTIEPAFQMGWDCTGQRRVDIRYLVFAKP